MSTHNISHSILCFSTPQANAFNTELDPQLRKRKTVALARLLNEFCAEVCRLLPERFSWLAILPLPYVKEAVSEARYALEVLGARGVGVLTNHEGVYPGDAGFEELWCYLEGRAREMEEGKGKEVVFIHPTEPVIRLEDGGLVNSRPCKYSLFLISPLSTLPPLHHPSLPFHTTPPSYPYPFHTQLTSLPLHSTAPLRPRRILLRNRPRNLQHHRLRHTNPLPLPPLADLPRRRRLPRHQRALPARVLEGSGPRERGV